MKKQLKYKSLCIMISTISIFSLLFMISSCVVDSKESHIGEVVNSQKMIKTAETQITLPILSTKVPTLTLQPKLVIDRRIQMPDFNYSLTVTKDQKWAATIISIYSKDADGKDHYEGDNIVVNDLKGPDSKGWQPLYSINDSYNKDILNLAFSPNDLYLAVISEGEIWFFETGNWEKRTRYRYSTWSPEFNWSPDSKGIAAQIVTNNYVLQYLSVDGKLTPLLTRDEVFVEEEPFGDDKSIYSWGPAYSPDGKNILFGKYYSLRKYEVWTKNLATGEEKYLTDGKGPFIWSGDGRRFIYEWKGLRYFDLGINNSTTISDEVYAWFFSAWSPNSKKIVVYNSRSSGLDPDILSLIDVESGFSEVLMTNKMILPYYWTSDNNLLATEREAGHTFLIWINPSNYQLKNY